MHVTAGEGVSITGEFVVTADHQGAPGLAHGGLLTAAFDETLGMLMWLLRTPAVTARLETDFHLPVPVGSTLHIAAHASAVRGRKVFTEAVGRLGGPDGAPRGAGAGAVRAGGHRALHRARASRRHRRRTT